MKKVNDRDYEFGDPRLLFKLWKELTGEDLTQESTASALVTCKGNKKGRTQ